MERSEKNKSRPSESFIIGVIAIVFLVLGYQTAVFIHQAAVLKIAANRDSPDTVFVHVPAMGGESGVSGRSASGQPGGLSRPTTGFPEEGMPVKTVRKNSEHSPKVEAVRRNLPGKEVETFRFDPNTVSIEELCRLGFSQKQAQSIDNYRRKGGRFSRPSDFAKSYVVSDSIYRRLEPYIDIPLVDLNLADSAAFDALPGIGGWFAARMIEHREALGGYSYKEQLMDIYRFDQEKFDALSDLVTVSKENARPYPLWNLPADSLRRHPYIGSFETAKAIVLYRESTPRHEWTTDALLDAGVLTASQHDMLSRCLIADI
ncbi:MAG: helix-hairpin-helix domain-containing protein [Bacteroidales bacterium]|nr:helix-hairpin-helix domain-containing protein [Bacteroidales bacterium]